MQVRARKRITPTVLLILGCSDPAAPPNERMESKEPVAIELAWTPSAMIQLEDLLGRIVPALEGDSLAALKEDVAVLGALRDRDQAVLLLTRTRASLSEQVPDQAAARLSIDQLLISLGFAPVDEKQ